MSETILEELMRQALRQGTQSLSLAWQGGEPTLMGIDFYRRALELQDRYRTAGQRVANALQTNGILIDTDWADFLRNHNFLVGLSLDGPRHIHDHYRHDRSGRGTWEKVADTAKLLLNSGVAVNALVAVTDYSVRFADEIYDYLKAVGFRYMQFIPLVETARDGKKAAPFCAPPADYGNFLCRLFQRWIADFQGGEPTTSIRYFESIFYRYVGLEPPDCTLMKTCGAYVVVEHDGSVYACDFFVEPQWKLGNIQNSRLLDLLNSERQRRFGVRKAQLPAECQECRWLSYCRGGCPKDRRRDPRTRGRDYFCQATKIFLEQADARLRQLATDWQRKHITANQTNSASRTKKPGRNDPCPCGSGRKYKYCCGRLS